MVQFKCKNCGSTDFTEKDGCYICDYCGSQYPIMRASTARPGSSAQTASQEVHVHVHMDNDNLNNTTVKSEKSWITTLLLCVFLGIFGIHRFYAGKIGTGLIWMFTGGAFLIGWVADIILIATGKFKDKNGRLITYH